MIRIAVLGALIIASSVPASAQAQQQSRCYVTIPVEGLEPVKRGNDTDLSTSMTLDDIAGLPDTHLQ